EVVGGEGRPLGLSAGQERQVQDMLPAAAARMKAPQAVLSRFSLEELIGEMDDDALEARSGETAAVAKAGSSSATLAAPPQSPDTSNRRRKTGVYGQDLTVE